MPPSKIDYYLLGQLGVQFDARQIEAIAEPESVYAWMVPWEVPDPIVFGDNQPLCEALIVRDPETDDLKKVIWPRVLWAADLEWDDDEVRNMNEECDWRHHVPLDMLPQVYGFEGHEQCDAFGCDHPGGTPLSVIGFWGAYPINDREANELEYAVMDGLHLGKWSPLVEFFAFQQQWEVDIYDLWNEVTDPYENPKSPYAENILEQYVALATQLDVDPMEPPDRDDFPLTTADFMLNLSPELHFRWETHRVRMDKTRAQLKALFPELSRYIEWSSRW
jgi:hypothetical protein